MLENGVPVKNREKRLFSLLILLLNTIGAVGSLLYVTQLTETVNQSPLYFYGGILLLCVISVFFWSEKSRRRRLLLGVIFFSAFCLAVFLCRGEMLNGLAWSLRDTVAILNEQYDIYLVWDWHVDFDEASTARWAVMGLLAVLTPYILLLGHGVVRSGVVAVVLVNSVWFVAACFVDRFPNCVMVASCVLGLAAVMVERAYADDLRAGIRAVFLGMAVLSIVMASVYGLLLPAFDAKYDEFLDARLELSRKVNDEWIPKIQSTFAQIGREEGVDVTGELDETDPENITLREIYRVTMQEAPRTTVYLRGFVGEAYAGDRWKAGRDSSFENYYREHELTLPENSNILVNLIYEAAQPCEVGFVQIEELAGAGKYSVYPYGAEVPEEYGAHWDGSVDRKSGVYYFPYRGLPERNEWGELTAEQKKLEEQYRRYVYDNFLSCPEERLPELTALMEGADFSRESFFEGIADVLSYLRNNTSYSLEAERVPAGEDFVEYFLFDSHEGYCAHYASAGVLMLRYLGIPARYAAGYAMSAGDFSADSNGNYTAVALDKQAHAWVEVYLDGVGWIPVEMTPGAIGFDRDNSMEQLTMVGRWSGAFEEKADTPVKTEQETDDSGQDLQQGTGGKQEGSFGQSGGIGHGFSTGTNTLQSGSISENRNQEKEGSLLGKKILAIVGRILCVGLILFSMFMAVTLVRVCCVRRLMRADKREKIFLRYRNLRLLLKLAGSSHRLESEETEAVFFRELLERCSFGEKMPEGQELRRAVIFCKRLAREEYHRLPPYKKPLYSLLNIYR